MIAHNQACIAPESPHLITTQPPQTWLEISTAAFNHNAAYYKKLIGAHHKLAAVIKGNGYGHGLEQIAFLCEQNKDIDWLCVAQLSEALALENISKPILVLGYADVNPEYAVNKNIHFMVDHLEYAHALHTIGKKHSYRFNIHIKVDTGLSRMGVLAADAVSFIQRLQTYDYLSITGIYSHFSASDSNPLFTHHQQNIFSQLLEQLTYHNIAIDHVHMSNSAALSTITFTPHFNFFRVGIGLYGIGHDRVHLKPVMTWKTHITNIKTIPAHSAVSYYGEYQTTKKTRVALLPIGYYDGYKFNFSNKTSVLINGSYAPVLGRVAMNITIVDVTEIDTHIGDEVIIMGPYATIDPHHLATLGNIVNVREILVGINKVFTRIITE
ncbi:MAG TPA: alanine racemase [Candidatus Babeliales bacterium]|nr:alanine racemase [Candidatus Babeliales bacterium]